MTTAFTVTVGESDWRGDLSGWTCSALAIPGAAIEAVYTQDTKVDNSWYETPHGLNVVRWVHGSAPPKKATIAIRLGKQLSTQELTVRWRKLAIVLPVLASILVGVAARVVPSTTPPLTTNAEAAFWTVTGVVQDTRQFAASEVNTFITPPDLRPEDDFTFKAPIPVRTRPDGSLEFPLLVFGIKGRPGFDSPVVHIVNPGEKLPPGAVDYDVEINPSGKTIEIGKAIEIRQPGQLPDQLPYTGQISSALKSPSFASESH